MALLSQPWSRRETLKLGAALPLMFAVPGMALRPSVAAAEEHAYLNVRDKVPDPETVFFEVQYAGEAPIKLAGHFWFNADTLKAGKKCPAIVEFNPYRRRDGTMIGDAKMYPWFAITTISASASICRARATQRA